MALELAYLGSVNRWECDENDHLNVRFFADKMNQAARGWLGRATGTAPVPQNITRQHIRFLAEARIATPLRVDCGLLTLAPGYCEVLSLMVHNLTEAPLAAFTSRFTGHFELSSSLVTAPGWAEARGLDPDTPFAWPETPDALEQLGFRTMGLGLVSESECSEGHLRPEHFIGRISDGMPNLWGLTAGDSATAAGGVGELGGAVLEYRLDVLAPPQAGDVFRQLSGIRAVANKTQHMVHAIVNETRGEIAARAEAIGVAMDLETRRAVPIDAPRRAALERLMVRGP